MRIKRLISLLTGALFLLHEIALPASALAANVSMAAREVTLPVAFNVALPSEIGTVDYLQTGSGPTIFHIQEAHGHPEAQKNIASILNYLSKEHHVDLVLLEGNSGKLKPELINFFPNDSKKTKTILKKLVNKGIATGPELFFYNQDDLEGFGIEDADLYSKNGQDFVEVLKARKESQEYLTRLQMQIERLSSPYLNQNLRAFLGRVDDYEQGKIPFETWLEELRGLAKEQLELDLQNPWNQVEWPMLLRIFTLKSFEARLNLSLYRTERDRFLRVVSSLSKPLAEEVAAYLTDNIPGGRLPHPETSLLFEKMIRYLPTNFKYQDYPHLNLFIGHLIMRSELDAESLMIEARKLAGLMAESYVGNSTEAALVEYFNKNRLLKKLFRLELTPDDVSEVLDVEEELRPQKMIRALQDLNTDSRVSDVEIEGIGKIANLYDKALEFYRGAKARDDHMLANIEKRIRATGKNRIAVVTGGFHAGPFQEYFFQAGYHYALITPAIETAIHQDKYVETMLKRAEERKAIAPSTHRPSDVFVGDFTSAPNWSYLRSDVFPVFGAEDIASKTIWYQIMQTAASETRTTTEYSFHLKGYYSDEQQLHIDSKEFEMGAEDLFELRRSGPSSDMSIKETTFKFEEPSRVEDEFLKLFLLELFGYGDAIQTGSEGTTIRVIYAKDKVQIIDPKSGEDAFEYRYADGNVYRMTSEGEQNVVEVWSNRFRALAMLPAVMNPWTQAEALQAFSQGDIESQRKVHNRLAVRRKFQQEMSDDTRQTLQRKVRSINSLLRRTAPSLGRDKLVTSLRVDDEFTAPVRNALQKQGLPLTPVQISESPEAQIVLDKVWEGLRRRPSSGETGEDLYHKKISPLVNGMEWWELPPTIRKMIGEGGESFIRELVSILKKLEDEQYADKKLGVGRKDLKEFGHIGSFHPKIWFLQSGLADLYETFGETFLESHWDDIYKFVIEDEKPLELLENLGRVLYWLNQGVAREGGFVDFWSSLRTSLTLVSNNRSEHLSDVGGALFVVKTKQDLETVLSDLRDLYGENPKAPGFLANNYFRGFQARRGSDAEETIDWWPNIMRLARNSGEQIQKLKLDGLAGSYAGADLSTQLEQHWEEFLEISDAVGERTPWLITESLNRLDSLKDPLGALFPSLIAIGKHAGERAVDVFKAVQYVLLKFADSPSDLELVSRDIMDLIDVVEDEQIPAIFSHAFGPLSVEINSRDEFLIWKQRLIELAKRTTSYNYHSILNVIFQPRWDRPRREWMRSPHLYWLESEEADFDRHFSFYYQILEQFPRLAYSALEGIVKAMDRRSQVLSVDLSDESQSQILEFIGKTNGFSEELYKLYLDEGDAGLTRAREFANQALNDDLSLEDIRSQERVFQREGYEGRKLVVASIQMAIPLSGASFVNQERVAGLFERYMSAGDRREDIPKSLRQYFVEGGLLQKTVHRLKEDAVFDPEKRVGAILNALRYPDGAKPADQAAEDAAKDRETFVDRLKDFLQERNESNRQEALAAFFAYVNHNDILKDKVDRIQDASFESISLLEELFVDKDNLSTLFYEVLDQEIPAELLLERGKQKVRRVEQLGNSILRIWRNPETTREVKAKAIQQIVKRYDEDDFRTKMVPLLEEEKELIELLDSLFSGELKTEMSKRALLESFFEPAVQTIQGELKKFEEIIVDGDIDLEFRVVKGVAHSLWGLCAGVCIATDVELWKKENFFLIAMIDKNSNQAVGYLHAYEKEVNGKKVLFLPGLNPSTELMSEVKAEDLYPRMIAAVQQIAKQGEYDAIHLPTDKVILSNRTDIMKNAQRARYKTYKHKEPIIWNTKQGDDNQVPEYPIEEVYVIPIHPEVTKETQASIFEKLESSKSLTNLTKKELSKEELLTLLYLVEDEKKIINPENTEQRYGVTPRSLQLLREKVELHPEISVPGWLQTAASETRIQLPDQYGVWLSQFETTLGIDQWERESLEEQAQRWVARLEKANEVSRVYQRINVEELLEQSATGLANLQLISNVLTEFLIKKAIHPEKEYFLVPGGKNLEHQLRDATKLTPAYVEVLHQFYEHQNILTIQSGEVEDFINLVNFANAFESLDLDVENFERILSESSSPEEATVMLGEIALREFTQKLQLDIDTFGVEVDQTLLSHVAYSYLGALISAVEHWPEDIYPYLRLLVRLAMQNNIETVQDPAKFQDFRRKGTKSSTQKAAARVQAHNRYVIEAAQALGLPGAALIRPDEVLPRQSYKKNVTVGFMGKEPLKDIFVPDCIGTCIPLNRSFAIVEYLLDVGTLKISVRQEDELVHYARIWFGIGQLGEPIIYVDYPHGHNVPVEYLVPIEQFIHEFATRIGLTKDQVLPNPRGKAVNKIGGSLTNSYRQGGTLEDIEVSQPDDHLASTPFVERKTPSVVLPTEDQIYALFSEQIRSVINQTVDNFRDYISEDSADSSFERTRVIMNIAHFMHDWFLGTALELEDGRSRYSMKVLDRSSEWELNFELFEGRIQGGFGKLKIEIDANNKLAFKLTSLEPLNEEHKAPLTELFVKKLQAAAPDDASVSILKTAQSETRALPLPDELVVLPDEAKVWVEKHAEEYQDLARFILEHLRIIPHAGTRATLVSLIQDFHQRLGDRPYIAAALSGEHNLNEDGEVVQNYERYKSADWMMDVALEAGLRIPAEVIRFVVSMGAIKKWLQRNPNVRDALILDDASFGGGQMAQDAEPVLRELRSAGVERVYMMLPYVQTRALMMLMYSYGTKLHLPEGMLDEFMRLREGQPFRHDLASASSDEYPEIYLLVGEIVPSVEEIFQEEIKKQVPGVEVLHQQAEYLFGENLDHHILTILQHKASDNVLQNLEGDSMVTVAQGYVAKQPAAFGPTDDFEAHPFIQNIAQPEVYTTEAYQEFKRAQANSETRAYIRLNQIEPLSLQSIIDQGYVINTEWGQTIGIVAEHQDVVPVWREAHVDGLIPKGSKLVHIDAHEDDGLFAESLSQVRPLPDDIQTLQSSPQAKEEYLAGVKADIDQGAYNRETFIAPEVINGLIDPANWYFTFDLFELPSLYTPFKTITHWRMPRRGFYKSTEGPIFRAGPLTIERSNLLEKFKDQSIDILDFDIDAFDALLEDKTVEEILQEWGPHLYPFFAKAKVITFASSPGFINQEKGVALINGFLQGYAQYREQTPAADLGKFAVEDIETRRVMGVNHSKASELVKKVKSAASDDVPEMTFERMKAIADQLLPVEEFKTLLDQDDSDPHTNSQVADFVHSTHPRALPYAQLDTVIHSERPDKDLALATLIALYESRDSLPKLEQWLLSHYLAGVLDTSVVSFGDFGSPIDYGALFQTGLAKLQSQSETRSSFDQIVDHPYWQDFMHIWNSERTRDATINVLFHEPHIYETFATREGFGSFLEMLNHYQAENVNPEHSGRNILLHYVHQKPNFRTRVSHFYRYSEQYIWLYQFVRETLQKKKETGEPLVFDYIGPAMFQEVMTVMAIIETAYEDEEVTLDQVELSFNVYDLDHDAADWFEKGQLIYNPEWIEGHRIDFERDLNEQKEHIVGGVIAEMERHDSVNRIHGHLMSMMTPLENSAANSQYVRVRPEHLWLQKVNLARGAYRPDRNLDKSSDAAMVNEVLRHINDSSRINIALALSQRLKSNGVLFAAGMGRRNYLRFFKPLKFNRLQMSNATLFVNEFDGEVGELFHLPDQVEQKPLLVELDALYAKADGYLRNVIFEDRNVRASINGVLRNIERAFVHLVNNRNSEAKSLLTQAIPLATDVAELSVIRTRMMAIIEQLAASETRSVLLDQNGLPMGKAQVSVLKRYDIDLTLDVIGNNTYGFGEESSTEQPWKEMKYAVEADENATLHALVEQEKEKPTYKLMASKMWANAIQLAEQDEDLVGKLELERWRDRSMATFHANLVYDPTTKKAGMILGDSGAGKSTLSYYLSKKIPESDRYTILADDDDSVYVTNTQEQRPAAIGNLHPIEIASKYVRLTEDLPLEVVEHDQAEFVDFAILMDTDMEVGTHVISRGIPESFQNDFLNSINVSKGINPIGFLSIFGGVPTLVLGSNYPDDYDWERDDDPTHFRNIEMIQSFLAGISSKSETRVVEVPNIPTNDTIVEGGREGAVRLLKRMFEIAGDDEVEIFEAHEEGDILQPVEGITIGADQIDSLISPNDFMIITWQGEIIVAREDLTQGPLALSQAELDEYETAPVESFFAKPKSTSDSASEDDGTEVSGEDPEGIEFEDQRVSDVLEPIFEELSEHPNKILFEILPDTSIAIDAAHQRLRANGVTEEDLDRALVQFVAAANDLDAKVAYSIAEFLQELAERDPSRHARLLGQDPPFDIESDIIAIGDVEWLGQSQQEETVLPDSAYESDDLRSALYPQLRAMAEEEPEVIVNIETIRTLLEAEFPGVSLELVGEVVESFSEAAPNSDWDEDEDRDDDWDEESGQLLVVEPLQDGNYLVTLQSETRSASKRKLSRSTVIVAALGLGLSAFGFYILSRSEPVGTEVESATLIEKLLSPKKPLRSSEDAKAGLLRGTEDDREKAIAWFESDGKITDIDFIVASVMSAGKDIRPRDEKRILNAILGILTRHEGQVTSSGGETLDALEYLDELIKLTADYSTKHPDHEVRYNAMQTLSLLVRKYAGELSNINILQLIHTADYSLRSDRATSPRVAATNVLADLLRYGFYNLEDEEAQKILLSLVFAAKSTESKGPYGGQIASSAVYHLTTLHEQENAIDLDGKTVLVAAIQDVANDAAQEDARYTASQYLQSLQSPRSETRLPKEVLEAYIQENFQFELERIEKFKTAGGALLKVRGEIAQLNTDVSKLNDELSRLQSDWWRYVIAFFAAIFTWKFALPGEQPLRSDIGKKTSALTEKESEEQTAEEEFNHIKTYLHIVVIPEDEVAQLQPGDEEVLTAKLYQAAQEDILGRDAREISEAHNFIFLHAFKRDEVPGPNSIIKQGVTWDQKLAILRTFNPSTAVSSFRAGDHPMLNLWSSFGIVVTDGHVDYASRDDAHTRADGIGERVRQEDYPQKWIKPQIARTLTDRDPRAYDEWGIKQPKIGGLYLSLDANPHVVESADRSEHNLQNYIPPAEFLRVASDQGLPAYLYFNNQFHRWLADAEEDAPDGDEAIRLGGIGWVRPVSFEEMRAPAQDYSVEQQIQVIDQVLADSPFQIEFATEQMIADWGTGRTSYLLQHKDDVRQKFQGKPTASYDHQDNMESGVSLSEKLSQGDQTWLVDQFFSMDRELNKGFQSRGLIPLEFTYYIKQETGGIFERQWNARRDQVDVNLMDHRRPSVPVEDDYDGDRMVFEEGATYLSKMVELVDLFEQQTQSEGDEEQAEMTEWLGVRLSMSLTGYVSAAENFQDDEEAAEANRLLRRVIEDESQIQELQALPAERITPQGAYPISWEELSEFLPQDFLEREDRQEAIQNFQAQSETRLSEDAVKKLAKYHMGYLGLEAYRQESPELFEQMVRQLATEHGFAVEEPRIELLSPELQSFLDSDESQSIRALFESAGKQTESSRMIRIGAESAKDLAVPMLRSILDPSFEFVAIVDDAGTAQDLNIEVRAYARLHLNMELNTDRFKVEIRDEGELVDTLSRLIVKGKHTSIVADGEVDDEISNELEKLHVNTKIIKLVDNSNLSVAEEMAMSSSIFEGISATRLDEKTYQMTQRVQYTSDHLEGPYAELLAQARALARILQAA